MNAQPDFAAFFERLAAVATLIRAQLCAKLAMDEAYARRVFKCYSATARLRTIAAVLAADEIVIGFDEPPMEGL